MHITVSHSHRLFLSTIFASNLPARIPAFASSRSPTCISCCSLLCLVSGFLFWFSHFTFWGLTRWCALFIVFHSAYKSLLLLNVAACNRPNSLSCAIRLLYQSAIIGFHWLLARNVNVLHLSMFAFCFCWFCWSCGIVHIFSFFSFTCKNECLYWNLVL